MSIECAASHRYNEERFTQRFEAVSSSPPFEIDEPRIAPEPSPALAESAENPDDAAPAVVYIGLRAYLFAMWNLFWSAFRYPSKTTEIDLHTGRIVRHF